MRRIRVEKSTNFTTINNEFIYNKNLSLKAKGMLCHLLALPNDWKLYVEEVEKWHKDGKSAIYSAFKELTDNGYMKREQKRDKLGKIISWDYVIFEKPHTDYQDVDNPDVDYPDVENRTLLNTNNNNYLNKVNTDKSKTERDYPFDLNVEAWELWKAFRKEQFRTTYKPLGEAAAISKILRISDNNKEVQAKIIQQSIENGWKGLFELKTEKQTKVQKILSNYQKGLDIINKEYE
jgi:predicted transcriptional regulator